MGIKKENLETVEHLTEVLKILETFNNEVTEVIECKKRLANALKNLGVTLGTKPETPDETPTPTE